MSKPSIDIWNIKIEEETSARELMQRSTVEKVTKIQQA